MPERVLVLQTAFLGDVVLTLPLVQALKQARPEWQIDMMVTPPAAPLLANHPAIADILPFDKRGADRGIGGLLRIARTIRNRHYHSALVPHRSLRSAFAVRGVPQRIGFDTSAGRFLWTAAVHYEPASHEVDRNLALLGPLGITPASRPLPRLYPSADDSRRVDAFLERRGVKDQPVAIAPGTVWNTKRWPAEHYQRLASLLVSAGSSVVAIGGEADRELCEGLRPEGPVGRFASAAGELTLLESAELIRRCSILVANDSAPMHLAVAVGTPVIAIYGPTLPGFGFAPCGPLDIVIEQAGLECRPCSKHGGDLCPIGTFVCMREITANRVHAVADRLLARTRGEIPPPYAGA